MNTGRYLWVGLAASAMALMLGTSIPASAGAGTTYCGYRAVDGAEQWTDRYVGRKQCPATSTSGGVQGYLVSSEYIA